MTNDAPRISVIIPTYGRPEYLGEALGSVVAQSYPAHEIIVVDDYSPQPIEIPSQLQNRVKLLRHARNQGAGAARNTGLAHASGELVIFLDDDDLLPPQRLEIAARGIGDAPMHAMAREKFAANGTSSIVDRPAFAGDLRKEFPYGEGVGDHPRTGQVVHRRETLLQFDPSLRRAQDSEWWIRMADSAIFVWSPEVGVRIRVHDGVRHHKTDSVFTARRLIAQRHGPTSSRLQRSSLYRAVAIAGAKSGHAREAAAWSLRSFLALPSFRAARFVLRSLAAALLPLAALRRQPSHPDNKGTGQG